MSDLHPFLLAAALHGDDGEAHAAWRRWRDGVDIQHLSWAEIQLLPLLNGPRWNEWLLEDEAAGLLKGIVRRAWTEAQVRLAFAQNIAEELEHACCGPVALTGSTGLHFRSWRQSSIRPIAEAQLLISRTALQDASKMLLAAGWQVYGDIPSGDGLDWRRHIPLHRGNERLHLQWRVLHVAAHQAAPCEEEFLSACEFMEAQGNTFRVLSATHALLEAMTERVAPVAVDPVPWQADCSLLLRESIDWERWRNAASTYDLTAFARLRELREAGLAVPALSPRPPEPLPQPRRDLRRYKATLHRWAHRAQRGARRLLPAREKV